MNPIFVACSVGPTLTAFAKVRSRCTSTSKIGIPNCQPSGQQEALVGRSGGPWDSVPI